MRAISDGGYVWVDGIVADAGEARVSPLDHGLLTGDGVFETMKVTHGRAFALSRHLARLDRSARGLGLVPPDHATVTGAVEAVLSANRLEEGRLRITLTGGPAPLGSERGPHGPTLVVACSTQDPWPATAEVVVVPWPRNERGAVAGLKTISYAENVVALAFARERGASEAVFANTAGRLCEGTGTNVFCGIAGRLLTPPLGSGCLAGVTRELVLEVTGAEEADLDIADLAGADEAFLTSSTRDVQSIHAVDGQPLPLAPGPLTAAAAGAFARLVADDLDP